MKLLSIKRIIILCFIAIFTCGAGYEGELPKILTSPEPINQILDIPPPIKPLAPRTFPAVHGGSILNQNKYSKYQKDIDPIVPKLENLKKTMLDKPDDQMQLFCAQVNVIDLYVNKVKDKYANKPERYYESYKNLIVMRDNITDTAYYWKTTRQYMRMIYKSYAVRKKEEAIFKKKFDNSLKSIDTVLEQLKDNLQKGAF
jgi:hypothetical protein